MPAGMKDMIESAMIPELLLKRLHCQLEVMQVCARCKKVLNVNIHHSKESNKISVGADTNLTQATDFH